MKPQLILKLAIGLFIFNSCNQSTQNDTEENSQVEVQEEVTNNTKTELTRDPRNIGPVKPESQHTIEENIAKINAEEDMLFGYWVGFFGENNNKINIALAKVDGDSIFGHSVCAGNFRSIKGTIEIKEADVYSINMMEPGDNKYDGEFQFEIDVNKKELIGTWKPYKQNVLEKENYTYTLYRRDFVYDESAGDHPEGSTDWLEPMDVENLLPEEIELIRNEIYARHGYSFTNLKMRRHFDPKEWYIPMSIDIRDQLTELEAHNIDMLYNYEDYYEEYYNDFGR